MDSAIQYSPDERGGSGKKLYWYKPLQFGVVYMHSIALKMVLELWCYPWKANKRVYRFQRLIEHLTWPLLVSWSLSTEEQLHRGRHLCLIFSARKHPVALREKNRIKKKYGSQLRSRDQWALCQQISRATPSAGMEARQGVAPAQSKPQIHTSLDKSFFSLMQKLSGRQIEMLAVLEEIHPAMNVQQCNKSMLFFRLWQGVPSLGYVRPSSGERKLFVVH